MTGQLSPDGNYYWDGVQWARAISPDGAWRWDGNTWKSATAAKGGGLSVGVAALISAGVIVALVVAGVGIFGVSRLLNNGAQSLQSHLSPACTASGMAGGAATQGTSVCGRKLGFPVVGVDCTAISTLPSALVAEEVASATADWSPADVGIDQHGCEMVAQPDEDLAIDSSDIASPDIVMIADFVPLNALGGVGLRLACTQDGSCIDVSIFSDESFSLDEGTTGQDSWKNLTQGSLVFGTMHFNQQNRLILRFVDGVASVFLNGYLVTQATPDIAQSSGFFGFYISDQESSAAEKVQLQRLLIFQAT
jgi:hypothetical protein